MATAKKNVKKIAGKPAAKEEGDKDVKKAKPVAGNAPGKEVVPYSEMISKLSSQAHREAEREANTGVGGTPFINTEGKQFSVGEDEEFGDSIQVVVLATAFFNAWYDRPYVRGAGQVPACYAVAEDEDDLAPPDDVPVRQNADCATCWANQWDSGPNDSGKACGNRRKLAVLLLSDLEEGIVRPCMLSLPPTALKFWGRYVKAIVRQHNLPPAGVVTRFDFDDENPQPCPIPTFEGLVGEDIMGLVFNAVDEGKELVMQKIDTSSYEPPSEGKQGKNKMARKGAGTPNAAREGANKTAAPVRKAPAKKTAGKSGRRR